MQYDGLIQGILPTKPISLFPSSSTNRLSFGTHFPTRTRYGFGSLNVRATINDGFVKPISEMSFYELLGIPETVNLFEIKRAYKQLARKYHPDVSPPDRMEEYTDRFIRVQEAYETLSDPQRRVMYDRDMARGLHLTFSARKRKHLFDEEMEDKSEWRIRWQGQLSELKKRSMYKDAGGSMSWGARMRQQRNESSSES